MVQSSTAGLVTLLTTYGYWAIFACIAIESTGIPFPGETMLLVAAIFAHRLSIPLVILAAESFAILGDNMGFWVGREGGFRRLAPLRAVHPPGRAQAQTGPLPLSPARGESGLLRTLRGGAAHVGRVSGGSQLHGVASLPALQRGGRTSAAGPLDDYRKAHRGERQSRLLTGQTPGRTERSHQRIGEEQPTVLVCETFDRVGQAFAQRRTAGQYAVPHGEAEKQSARKIVFHKIMFVKETVVHE
jgi:hypothetical protein